MDRLVYISSLNEELSAKTFDEFLKSFSFANKLHDITGCLYINKKTVVQILEGEKRKLDQLMENIDFDNRHTVHRVHWFRDVKKRKFPNWSMKNLTDTEVDENMEKIHNLLRLKPAISAELILESCVNILESYYFIKEYHDYRFPSPL